MGRSQESFNKKAVRTKKEKKRKEKAEKRAARRDTEKKSGLDDMIAYVDAHGQILSSPPEMDEREEINAEDIEVSVPKGNNTAADQKIRSGILTFFNDSKGFGFIKDLETKQDVFVHINSFIDDIREGNKVEYEMESGPRGPVATNVKLLKV